MSPGPHIAFAWLLDCFFLTYYFFVKTSFSWENYIKELGGPWPENVSGSFLQCLVGLLVASGDTI